MSDQEKRNLVKAIEELSTEKKLMTLGYVEGLKAAMSAEKANG